MGGMPIQRLSTKRRWKLRALLWIAAIGFVAVCAWCGSLYYVITHYDGNVDNKNAGPADAGIVLGATLWDDRPSPGLAERLDRALELYRAGAFSHVIVTGGLDDNGATVTEAEGMKAYLVAKGVPERAIVTEPLARSTYENLLNSRKLMEERGWKTAVIVTHSYHGSRAANIARSLDYEAVSVAVTDSKVLKLSYHRTREVLAYTKWLLEKPFV
ncbi:YdcF family protein [Cohnella suwonensis]|uniref:YdcF family protein n=1 Tax=Cohnella suwonensis TaxID=696072 RepID=A0ABW0LP15_9BACL